MKKLLALVLALVMSMSLVTISNAAFKDADKIDYKEAVDVMNAVGVFIGDEKGNFNAKENLTREQAAKIIAYLELGSKAADALVGGATFTDVASTRWSAGFIGYCAQAGVVAGYDGKFDPAGQLTALQFGKMLLVELGYDAKAAGMVGADWAAKIISFGIVIGLATVVMVLLLGLTRVVFAMSRDGLLPRSLSHTGKHGTPVRLQIAVGVVMALIAASCNVSILADMVNIGTLSAFTLVSISIPIMRKKRPDLKRVFKIPGNPWVPILIALANIWLMLNLSVLTWIRFVVWLIVGFAIYFGYGYRHARLGTGELEVGNQE